MFITVNNITYLKGTNHVQKGNNDIYLAHTQIYIYIFYYI